MFKVEKVKFELATYSSMAVAIVQWVKSTHCSIVVNIFQSVLDIDQFVCR